MAAAVPVAPRDRLRDLAARISTELVRRNVVVTEGAAQIKSDSDNLAKISFKLAEAFQRVGTDINAP